MTSVVVGGGVEHLGEKEMFRVDRHMLYGMTRLSPLLTDIVHV